MQVHTTSKRTLTFLGLAILLSPAIHAATLYTWTQTTAGDYDWSDSGNWSGGNVPLSDSGTQISIPMPASGTIGIDNNLASPFTLNRLTFNSQGVTTTLNLGGGSLSFVADGGTVPEIRWDVPDATAQAVIANDIAIPSGQLTLYNTNAASNGAPRIIGTISGAGGLTSTAHTYHYNPTAFIEGTANTYTGPTIVTGFLAFHSIGNIGEPSSLGQPANAADGTIVVRGKYNGTGLVYLGNGDTTDRVVEFRHAGSYSTYTLNASGTGPLVLTSDLAMGSSASHNVVLSGSSLHANTIGGTIPDYAVDKVTSLTKSGNGLWVLAGDNTAANYYTGTTTIQRGILRGTLGPGGSIGTGNLNLEADQYGWPVFESSADIVRPGGTGPGEMRISKVRYIAEPGAGFSAYGDINVAFGSLEAPDSLVWDEGYFQPGGTEWGRHYFVLNASTAQGTLNFRNPIDLNGATRRVSTMAAVAIISGDLTGGAGSALDKHGAGVLSLTGSNSYPGATSVYAGVLRARDGVGLPSSSNLTMSGGIWESDTDMVRPLGGGAGQMRFNGSGGFSALGEGTVNVAFGSLEAPTTLTWTQNGFTNGVLTLNAASATGTLDFRNPVNLNGAARTVRVEAGTAIMSGEIIGWGNNGYLIKAGEGTLKLTANNAVAAYVWGTTVQAGTLLVENTSGSATGRGYVRVNDGATLGGSGIIAPWSTGITADSGATIAPGSSIGTLTLNGAGAAGAVLTMDSGARFAFEVDDFGDSDRIVFWNYVAGDLVLNDNAIDLSVLGPFGAGLRTYTVTLFEFYSDNGSTPTASDMFGGLTLGSLDPRIYSASLVFNANSIDLVYAVPEPASLAWLGLGGLLLIRRRRAKA